MIFRYMVRDSAGMILLAAVLVFSTVCLAQTEESDLHYVDLVKNSTLDYNATATVAEVFAGYPYFQEVKWRGMEHQGRPLVEVTVNYDLEATLNALAEADPEDPGLFVDQSLGEIESVVNTLYFSMGMDNATVQPPSQAGLVICKNGKRSTFQPGSSELIFTSQPPDIKDLYRRCFD